MPVRRFPRAVFVVGSVMTRIQSRQMEDTRSQTERAALLKDVLVRGFAAGFFVEHEEGIVEQGHSTLPPILLTSVASSPRDASSCQPEAAFGRCAVTPLALSRLLPTPDARTKRHRATPDLLFFLSRRGEGSSPGQMSEEPSPLPESAAPWAASASSQRR